MIYLEATDIWDMATSFIPRDKDKDFLPYRGQDYGASTKTRDGMIDEN